MRTLITAAIAASAVFVPIAASAQDNPYEARREYRDEVRDARHDYSRDVRNADSPRDIRRARQEYRGEVRDARQDYRGDMRQWRGYDYNRFEPGQGSYYADRYYRGGYQPIVVNRQTRVYRGNNGRYYCRRSDGSTGLIVGALAGGALGNVLTSGRSSLLGTLVGAGAGAALGSSIDRGQVTCR